MKVNGWTIKMPIYRYGNKCNVNRQYVIGTVFLDAYFIWKLEIIGMYALIPAYFYRAYRRFPAVDLLPRQGFKLSSGGDLIPFRSWFEQLLQQVRSLWGPFFIRNYLTLAILLSFETNSGFYRMNRCRLRSYTKRKA